MDPLFSSLLSGLGLSGAAGLNAYIPLLLVGVLGRLDVLHLSPAAAWLSNPWVLLVVLVLGALDFVGDKVPGIDHALHVFGGVVNAAAGAILFAGQHGGTALSPGLNPVLAGVLGLLVSGGVQAARTVLRPVSTGVTAGLGNPLVSSAEDGSSLLLSVLAVFAPVLGALLLLALLLLIWRVFRTVRRRVF